MGEAEAGPSDIREKALTLRLQGRSYREITAVLGVPKSTLSSWLRDVPLTEEHQDRLELRQLHGARDRAAATRAGRIRRTQELQSVAASEIGRVSDRELFLLGVTAYWCEGSKTKPWAPSAQVTFVNSDPGLILLFLRWLDLLRVEPERLVFTVAIHENADLEVATRYWSDLVGVPAESFRRPTLKRHNPSTVRRNTGLGYVGCLVVRVRRSSDLNRRIEGWWRGIENAIPTGTASSVPYDEGDSGVV